MATHIDEEHSEPRLGQRPEDICNYYYSQGDKAAVLQAVGEPLQYSHCAICKFQPIRGEHAALQFDHLVAKKNGGIKTACLASWNTWAQSAPKWVAIGDNAAVTKDWRAELALCQMLCKNCHDTHKLASDSADFNRSAKAKTSTKVRSSLIKSAKRSMEKYGPPR